MIQANLTLGDQMIVVSINGNDLVFTDIGENQMTTIEGLKLSKEGTIKEFPDLKDDPEWKPKAIQRFKEHYQKIQGEKPKMDYIVKELKGVGYIPRFWQRKGFRVQKFREEL